MLFPTLIRTSDGHDLLEHHHLPWLGGLDHLRLPDAAARELDHLGLATIGRPAVWLDLTDPAQPRQIVTLDVRVEHPQPLRIQDVRIAPGGRRLVDVDPRAARYAQP